MGGRASFTSKGEPIVSLVGDDRVRSLVVVAGITDRSFSYVEVVVVEETCVNGSQVLAGYLENSDKASLLGKTKSVALTSKPLRLSVKVVSRIVLSGRYLCLLVQGSSVNQLKDSF